MDYNQLTKDRIAELFKPTLLKIEEQTSCVHDWMDKDGAAYFRCSICGYLADDKDLDNYIFVNKLLDKGMKIEDIKHFLKL